jgi:hypothetical protein
MNWPLDPDAACVVCDTIFATQSPIPGLLLGSGLTWGLVHGECRCNTCHTTYTMRDENGPVTTPISEIKEEWLPPARTAWAEHHVPLDELTLDQWEAAGAPVNELEEPDGDQ